MQSLTVVVCGGREFDNREWLYSVMDKVLRTRPLTLVIEGGALGADRLAREWCRDNCVACETVEADWNAFGKSAGPMRNRQMLDMSPDALIAFPGGRGTANIINEARKRGITVWEPK